MSYSFLEKVICEILPLFPKVRILWYWIEITKPEAYQYLQQDESLEEVLHYFPFSSSSFSAWIGSLFWPKNMAD